MGKFNISMVIVHSFWYVYQFIVNFPNKTSIYNGFSIAMLVITRGYTPIFLPLKKGKKLIILRWLEMAWWFGLPTEDWKMDVFPVVLHWEDIGIVWVHILYIICAYVYIYSIVLTITNQLFVA